MTNDSPPAPHADDRMLTLAFYVVVDVSISMEQNGVMSDVNTILPSVIDAIETSPTLGDVVRFGAMDFSDDARVVLRLDDVRNVSTVPTFSVRGGTSFASVFRLLRREIERDYAQLRGDNCRVYRPAVFFITDGLPGDDPADLKAAFDELTEPSFKARPNIIVFGIGGGVTKEALDPWVFPKPADSKKPMRSYVHRNPDDAAQAIRQIAEILVSSVLASAASVSAEGSAGGLVLPNDEDLDDDWI